LYQSGLKFFVVGVVDARGTRLLARAVRCGVLWPGAECGGGGRGVVAGAAGGAECGGRWG